MRVKRKLDICVISDVHLGTYGCHAKELNSYLKSISPKVLILNGDIIDIWNFRKSYFPKEHLAVLRNILKLAGKGTKVHYITGNHDEALRRFSNFNLGGIHLRDHLSLQLEGGTAWFFHGDIFDHSIQRAKFIAKLGGWGYDLLILMNRFLNNLLERMGREKYSFSKRIKNSVKGAVKFISDFEQVAGELAIDKGHRWVVCGHIHQPAERHVQTEKGTTTYLNSGDWVENLTALEYTNERWSLYQYDELEMKGRVPELTEDLEDVEPELTTKELLSTLKEEFLKS